MLLRRLLFIALPSCHLCTVILSCQTHDLGEPSKSKLFHWGSRCFPLNIPVEAQVAFLSTNQQFPLARLPNLHFFFSHCISFSICLAIHLRLWNREILDAPQSPLPFCISLDHLDRCFVRQLVPPELSVISQVSAVEECPLSGVPLYYFLQCCNDLVAITCL